MNIIDLNIFITIAKLGSINQTAKQLNYAQSNITARLNKFEQQIQTTLFNRTKAGVTLTEKGHMLLPIAKEMIALSEAFKQRAQDLSLPTGHLHISTVENLTKLPVIFSKFINHYPDIELTLSANKNDSIINDVTHHQIDGAFISRSASDVSQKLTAIEIYTDQLVMITPPHINQVKEAIEQPLIHYKEGTDYRGKLDAWLSQEKYTLPRTMQMNTLDSVVNMVSAGLGCSYGPYSYVESFERKSLINIVSMPESFGQLTTSFIYRNSQALSPSLKAFIHTVKEIKASFSGPILL